jgi:hypothetical protein
MSVMLLKVTPEFQHTEHYLRSSSNSAANLLPVPL